MSNTVLKDRGGVIKYGGGIIRVIECTDAGVTTGTGYIELPYLQVSNPYDRRSSTPVYDEAGDLVKRDLGDRDVGISATLMQTDLATLDFLIATEQKFYQIYIKLTKTAGINGVTQELFAALGQFVPQWDMKSGEKRLPIEIKLYKNESDVTIATPATAFGSIRSASLTISANTYYLITET